MMEREVLKLLVTVPCSNSVRKCFCARGFLLC